MLGLILTQWSNDCELLLKILLKISIRILPIFSLKLKLKTSAFSYNIYMPGFIKVCMILWGKSKVQGVATLYSWPRSNFSQLPGSMRRQLAQAKKLILKFLDRVDFEVSLLATSWTLVLNYYNSLIFVAYTSYTCRFKHWSMIVSSYSVKEIFSKILIDFSMRGRGLAPFGCQKKTETHRFHWPRGAIPPPWIRLDDPDE